MKIENENLGTLRGNVPNSVVAGATCTFSHLIFQKSRWGTGVLVILANDSTIESATCRFSLTRNLAVMNRGRERAMLDTSDYSGLIHEIAGNTANDVVASYGRSFPAFLNTEEGKSIKIKFGDTVHFIDNDGTVLRTILRIEKAEVV